MLFAENEGASFLLHAFAIAFEHSSADVFAFQRKVSHINRKMRADGESNQIIGVGHGAGFVKIIHAPDQAAFHITPGAEVFHVKITDGENARRVREFRADLRPELSPAIVSRAKEREEFVLHASVFEAEVLLFERHALGKPFLEVPSGLDDVHAGTIARGDGEVNPRKRRGRARSHKVTESGGKESG